MNYPSDFDPAEYLPNETPAAVYVTPQTPEPDEPRAAPRQPHLGYAALLLVLWFLGMLLAAFFILLGGRLLHLLPPFPQLRTETMPKTSILIEALGYGFTFAAAVPLFSSMWRRSFAEVIHWTGEAARRYAGRLLFAGITLSIVAQLLESHMTLPKKMPMDAFFRTPADVLLVAGFGTFIAPLAEEIFFRGFLFPAFAIAWDWLRLPRTEEGRTQWHSTSGLSNGALLFGGVLSSLLFAVLHAAQLGFAWNAVGVLWLVGGALTFVRFRLNSVAASSLVHMAYNGFIFVAVLIGTGGLRHMDRLLR